MPFQRTDTFSPAAGTARVHDLTTEPSSSRTSDTTALGGGFSVKRKVNFTPPRWSSANIERLVAVSRPGEPAALAPGAGVSRGLGAGAAGGRIFTALRVSVCVFAPTQASSGPLCAFIGTGTGRLESLAGSTRTATSSPEPGPPR